MENQTPPSHLRPFDIEKAKNGAKVVTEKGETVEIFKYDLKRNGEEFIIALVMHTPESTLCLYHQDGRVFEPYRINGFTYDLMIKPSIREGWVNIYENGTKAGLYVHKTKEDALSQKSEGCNFTVRIEWEE